MAELDERTFREVMSRLATGVTIVTTHYDGRFHGITVNSFCPVSAEPPLVLVCIDRLTQSHDYIAASGVFAVNIVGWRQMFLADRFAGRGPLIGPSFQEVPHRTAVTGAPILAEGLAWLDCRLWATYQGGDHTIFGGRVVACGQMPTEQEPLIFYNQRFVRLA